MKAKRPDHRRVPLRDFFHDRYKELRGVKLLTDKTDWKAFEKMLTQAEEFTLEQLQESADRFLMSESRFHQEQGHPLRFWSSNLNAFVGNGISVWKLNAMTKAISEAQICSIGGTQQQWLACLKRKCLANGITYEDKLYQTATERMK